MDGPSKVDGPGVKWTVFNIEWLVGKLDGPKGESGRSKG